MGNSKITKEIVAELLKQNVGGSLFHREQVNLEYKESFNLSGLAEYFRDFAAFTNNGGGYLIFGITDSPRKLVGLSKKSIEQFSKIDEERISGFINEHFSPYINWEMNLIKIKNKNFGVFYIYKADTKPVICKKGDDRQNIKNGEIYYRYAGRTEVIQYAELAHIIENRIKENNSDWVKNIKKMGDIGPSNIGILNTTNGLIEANERTLLIDSELIKEINFIKEGSFDEKKGEKTLKLVGSVEPINPLEVTKVIKKSLNEIYPYSYKKLESLIKKKISDVKVNKIQKIIQQDNLKNDTQYSVYNFRNKDQEDEYKKTGKASNSIPSIYNEDAYDYIVKVLLQKEK